jgi:hypothetical protein
MSCLVIVIATEEFNYRIIIIIIIIIINVIHNRAANTTELRIFTTSTTVLRFSTTNILDRTF